MEQPKNSEGGSPYDWRKIFRRISVIIAIGILVNLIIIVLYSEDLDLSVLISFRPGYLLLAVIVGILPLLLNGLAVRIWGRYYGVPLTLRDGLHVSSAALLGSAVTPTLLGGGPLKLGLLVMHRLKAAQAAVVVMMSSIQDAIAFVVIAAISIVLSDTVSFESIRQQLSGREFSAQKTAAVIGIAILTLLLLRWLLIRTSAGQGYRRRIRNGWKDFATAFRAIAIDGKMVFAATVLISLMRWVLMYLILVILVMALGEANRDLMEIWSLQWIVFSGMTVTPLPGGAGGAEAGFYLVYKSFFSGETIIGLILVWRFFTSYIRLVYAALLLIFLPVPGLMAQRADQ